MSNPLPPSTPSFAHQAAKLGWVCPLIMFAVTVFGRRLGSTLIIDLIGLLFILLGLVFSVIALCGIGKHGIRGLLAQGLVGLLINGLLLFIFVTNFLSARTKAQHEAGAEIAPVVLMASGEVNKL